MDIVTFDEAKRSLKAVMDRAPVLVTRQEAEAVVIVSLADWNAMQETMHLMASGANAARLLESIAEMDARREEPD